MCFVSGQCLCVVLEWIIDLKLIKKKNHNFSVGQFAEDGSFIGQYIPGKPPVSPPTPHNINLSTVAKPSLPANGSGAGNSSAAVATYV